MVRGTNRGMWKWSLAAACLLYGTFYALSYTGLGRFSHSFALVVSQGGDGPSVTISMVLSEFMTTITELSSRWSWVICWAIIALLMHFVVGWWAARKTGSVKAGILAGLWAGLFYGLISFIFPTVSVLLSLQLLLRGSSNPFFANMQRYAFVQNLVDNISVFLFFFLCYGLLAGFAGGLLGALSGAFPSAPEKT